MKQEKKKDPEYVRKSKTFFTLIFPSIILAILPSDINGNVAYALVLKMMVFIWQYITLRNFIDSTL